MYCSRSESLQLGLQRKSVYGPVFSLEYKVKWLGVFGNNLAIISEISGLQNSVDNRPNCRNGNNLRQKIEKSALHDFRSRPEGSYFGVNANRIRGCENNDFGLLGGFSLRYTPERSYLSGKLVRARTIKE